MEFGVTMFVTDYLISATELAIAIEERGFDALFVPDHIHIPSDRKSPFGRGGKLPDDYILNHDMFVTLTAAAAVTQRIRLGVGVCLIIERDPIVTAKQVASLDQVSNGRVDFGVGGGWNREEMENHGTPWNRRWKILHERVQAMKTIWMHEEASYKGEFVEFKNYGLGRSLFKNHIRLFTLEAMLRELSIVFYGTVMVGFRHSAAMSRQMI